MTSSIHLNIQDIELLYCTKIVDTLWVNTGGLRVLTMAHVNGLLRVRGPLSVNQNTISPESA